MAAEQALRADLLHALSIQLTCWCLAARAREMLARSLRLLGSARSPRTFPARNRDAKGAGYGHIPDVGQRSKSW
jgi:hypothetical protein